MDIGDTFSSIPLIQCSRTIHGHRLASSSSVPRQYRYNLTRSAFASLIPGSPALAPAPAPSAVSISSRPLDYPQTAPTPAPHTSTPTPNAYDSVQTIRRAAAAGLPLKAARRNPKDTVAPSPLRPEVPADRRLLMWLTPHSLETHAAMHEAGISPDLQIRIFEGLLSSHVPETRESYAAGLKRFVQFCDRNAISESARMPADRFLLSAFVAEAIGTCTGKCIRNWLNGLQLWHLFNDAPWHGSEGWIPALKKSADKAGVQFKRPPRAPISLSHLRALRVALDLTSPLGAAVWAAALAAFWGCRRLGELLIRSTSKFSQLRDTCRSTPISRKTVEGRSFYSIQLIWTKTTQLRGGECYLTATSPPDADLCPVWAITNHLEINHSPPAHTPLFAFRTTGGWRHLTKQNFLNMTSPIFKSAGLEQVLGHSYRIGGSVELLKAGIAPEIIMKLGGWSSLCFLIYWRRLEQILPAAITRAWNARIAAFARGHGHPVDIELPFD
ncbi:hypothetical protein C8F01DRAFT_1265473 [Mycena amicta]|nr:hypothetical protein C8F01DRAFT_1265473 [Mycena amicta]